MGLNVINGGLEFDALIKDSQFDAAIRRIEARLQGLTDKANQEAQAIDNLVKKAAQGIAAYMSLTTATNFISDMIKVRGEFQQLEVAFSTMLGSKARADKLLAQVTDFAATTPFELTEVAAATKQLLAFGIAAEDIPKTLRQIGDISAGIGAPLGEIAYLFGTIKTQGVALTQDVRQFANRGIPVYEELAKVLGVNVERVGDLITAGKVGFPEIQQVFENLTAEGAKFGGLMEEQSKTLLGQISNLRDSYDQMLNKLGQSSEGVVVDTIESLNYLVENYETVLDILKVLIITYGSYRAALIATNAVQAVSTTLTKGYTIAETLRYQAMLLSERAMKLLNATMLKNPAAWVVAGITAIVSALIIFRREATQAQKTEQMLTDVRKEAAAAVLKEKEDLKGLVQVAKDETASKEERLEAIRKINSISPEYLGNLTLETINTAEARKAIDEYIKSLERLAYTKAIDNKRTEIYGDLAEAQIELDKATKNLEKFIEENPKADSDLIDAASQILGLDKKKKEVEGYKKQLEGLKELEAEVIISDAKNAPAKRRTIAVIEDEISALEKQKKAESATAAERIAFDEKINKLKEELKKITGESNSELNKQRALEDKILALLEKRKDLLQDIADIVEESQLTGKTKEQTELEKINDTFDKLIESIDHYNKAVDSFNKKNPTKAVDKIGQAEIKELNDARQQALQNTTLKQDAEQYKTHLEKMRVLYDQFEEAKKQIGLERASELFRDQIKDYESYLQLLQEESQKLLPKVQFGIANVGEVKKFQSLVDAYLEYQKKKNKEALDEQIKLYADMLSATQTFEDKKKSINQKYDKLEAELNARPTLDGYEERSENLRRQREAEIKALQDSYAGGYKEIKNLFAGIEDLSDAAAKKVITDAKSVLDALVKEGKISEEFAREIKKKLEGAERSLSERLPDRLHEMAWAMTRLASAAEEFDSALADILETFSQILDAVGDVRTGMSDFKAAKGKGDILGQVSAGAGIAGAALGVISAIVSIGKRNREERRRQQEEMRDFLTKQYTGEYEINLLYQQRAREQVKINKLKLEGLKAERELLLQQKNELASQYQSVFEELQNETFRQVRNIGDIFGGNNPFNAQFIGTGSLFGKTYEELEELFIKGQLEGRAKELFETLKKIKEAGYDIDKILEENAAAAREMFTGTTADSIVDSIADGFANGLRSASDFADNFEELMRKAIINSLKYKYLEGPLQEFYQRFAEASESGGELTQAEIDQLQAFYNSIIENAQHQFDQLQQISGVNASGGSSANTLQGAIKGMTETQAELLAGQFGGLRLTALETLQISKSQLDVLNLIQVNTALAVVRMNSLLQKFDSYESGAKTLNVKVQ